jgi:SAM-dependent methyltransferase
MPPRNSLAHWDSVFAHDSLFYGEEPGPIARRAEKYHRDLRSSQSTALDVGCGEGQDLAFLAACGYESTGLDFSPHARRKARALLESRALSAQVLATDLGSWRPAQRYDLVLASNSLPFVGENADFALAQVLAAVAAGGVLGLSVWAREDASSPAVVDEVRLWTREEVFAAMEASGAWQKLEVALLWQYFRGGPGMGLAVCEEARPFITVVAQRLK